MSSGSNLRYRNNQEIGNRAPLNELREHFKRLIQELFSHVGNIGEADIVVGIPFYNEVDTIEQVLRTVEKGLKKYFPKEKCAIVAVGSPAGKRVLKLIDTLPKSPKIHREAFLLNSERLDGKGWHVRAIMEIARNLGADLAILEADLSSRTDNEGTRGLTPDWINLLLRPIRQDRLDLAISRFNRHWFESPIAAHLVYPLLAAMYNSSVHDPIGAQWGISYRLIRILLQNSDAIWSAEIAGYGVDSWLATTAITSDARIGEVNLGAKISGEPEPLGKRELVLRQISTVLFEQIIANKNWWREETELPFLKPLPNYGLKKKLKPDEVYADPQQLIAKYKQGFNIFNSLYRAILPEEIYEHLERLSKARTTTFDFNAKLWVKIVYHFLLSFAPFTDGFAKGDLAAAFIYLQEGRMAAFAKEMQAKRERLEPAIGDEAEYFVLLEAERQIEEQVNEFIEWKSEFLSLWDAKEVASRVPLPKVTYRQFIPGVPLVVPLELMSPDGSIVTADSVYETVFHEYKQEFENFIYKSLQVSPDAGSQEIVSRIKDFIHEVEQGLDEVLSPGDLYNTKGAREAVEAIFKNFPHQDVFTLNAEMASWLLWRHPPYNLITKLGYSNLNKLLGDHAPGDILTLAIWSEEQPYTEQLWQLLRDSIRAEHFELSQLKPIVASYEEFPSLLEMKESTLNKLTGRVLVSNLHKGMGGEFPKLRYFTTIAKSIIESERYSLIWQRFASEKKGFSEKVVNSILGHWGREPLSAHNIFEDGNQRILVERLKEIARRIAQETKEEDRIALAKNLKMVADSYHLSLTLTDGTFIPCSAWTWASYSFKGGTGLPTPLSLHVERDWTSRKFLLEYFKATGGKEEVMEEKIIELMEQGMESEDLGYVLLGGEKETESIVIKQAIPLEQEPAGILKRYEGNPILKPISEHEWESKYVLNPGAISIKSRIYLVYRAVGKDNISRLGLAVSEDGFNFTQRLEKPIFLPKGKSEERGCEDPRLTKIGDRIYMLYTAYGSLVAQIALASISEKDFLNYHWRAWHRHGLIFPGFTDKNGAIFPEMFHGRYAILHRVEPNIWITFTPHLRPPWPRGEHKILAGAHSGMAWDGLKIGSGAPPIKTRYGWLLITHGVDHSYTYRLGVMLLDSVDPTSVLYRSPNPILEPKEKYEIGKGNKFWVPNVVYTCGAVFKGDSEKMLNAGDELLVYYGAADTAINVAMVKIGDFIPEGFIKADI